MQQVRDRLFPGGNVAEIDERVAGIAAFAVCREIDSHVTAADRCDFVGGGFGLELVVQLRAVLFGGRDRGTATVAAPTP